MSRRRPTSDRLASSGDAHGRVPPGYGERHVRTVRSGTGEARLGSLVSKDRTYKPVVKSSGAKRESDGVVVLPIAGMNPAGGKDPDFGHAGARGTRKGMAGTAQSNYPGGRSPDVNVRRLQNRLWATAKQHSERRFHALYDRIYRRDVLWEAWERVRANRGAAGVDGVTLAAVEEYGPARLIDGLARDLRAGNYHPAPVRRVEIPKPDGRTRPLGIPTVKDRIAQQATKLVLEPIFEADFLSCSFGFRPKRSALDAMEKLRVGFIEGSHFVFEADIENFFGTIDHDKLLSLVGERVSDRRVLKLLRGWLAAGVLADGVVTETVSGTPQGGVISPLLANVYLHAFDRAWAEQGVGEVRPLCGRLRRALSLPGRGREGQGGRSCAPLRPRSHPPSGQDEDRRPPGGQRGLRLPRVPLPCPHVRQALGAEADYPLLPPPLAVVAVDDVLGRGSRPSRPEVRSGRSWRWLLAASTSSFGAGATTSAPGTLRPSSSQWTATSRGGCGACSSRSAAATSERDRRQLGPAPGSTTRSCTNSWAQSDTRKLRNHVQNDRR